MTEVCQRERRTLTRYAGDVARDYPQTIHRSVTGR